MLSRSQTDFETTRVLVIVQFVAAVLLFAALGSWPYGYYRFLRVAVFVAAAFSVVHAHQNRFWIRFSWFIVIGMLFNPVFPVYMRRQTWQSVDAMIGWLFLLSAFATLCAPEGWAKYFKTKSPAGLCQLNLNGGKPGARAPRR